MELNTALLFYDQPYLRGGSAWLDSVERDPKSGTFVTLSQTVFYPQGGGQKGDRGHLLVGASGEPGSECVQIDVRDTRKGPGGVQHYVDVNEEQEALLQSLVGKAEIDFALNWEFRSKQMRIHSAGHLIHCHIEKVTGRQLPIPLRSPLEETSGENQYNATDLVTPNELAAAIVSLNAFIVEDHPIVTVADDERGPGFRWWKCEGWNIPCGGVHPKSTGEIGPIRADMRVKKGSTRVLFEFA